MTCTCRPLHVTGNLLRDESCPIHGNGSEAYKAHLARQAFSSRQAYQQLTNPDQPDLDESEDQA